MTADSLAPEIASRIQEIVAAGGPAGLYLGHILAGLHARDIEVSRETLSRWLITMHSAHQVQARDGRWVPAPAQLLAWDKPPQARPHEEWASYQADSAPPGTYQPNMSPEWMGRWKAKMCGQRSSDLAADLRVEIRKTVGRAVQMKVVVFLSGEILMSMNGTAEFTSREFAELPLVVAEAREAMRQYARQHPAKLPA